MYRKILVPLDGSKLAECVLPHVDALARGAGAPKVVFVTVVEPVIPPARGELVFPEEERRRLEEAHIENAGGYLQAVSGEARTRGLEASHAVLRGQPAEAIADYASAAGADLIVLATHGRGGLARWVLGSVADRVSRSSCVPVMVVRAPGCPPPESAA